MSEPQMITVGHHIRAAREAAGMSQQELAEKIGSDRTAVSRWEEGNRSPSVDKLMMIADAVRVPVQDLVATAKNTGRTRYDYLHSMGLVDLAEYLALMQYESLIKVYEAFGIPCGEEIYDKLKKDWIRWMKEPVQILSTLQELIAGRSLDEGDV